MLLIVGLGNPGKKCESTRHNAGWLFLDYFKNLHEADFELWKEKKKLNALISDGSANFQTLRHSDFRTSIVLVKPTTFMNDSGLAVSKLTTTYNLQPITSLIVVHDDIDIPFGDYKIQTNRGPAGHHGVESIIEHLGTKNFTRVRIGISPKKDFAERIKETKAMDHVLKRFSKAEQDELKKIFRSILEKLIKFL